MSASCALSVPEGSVTAALGQGVELDEISLELLRGGESVGGSSYVKYCFMQFTCIEPFCNFP